MRLPRVRFSIRGMMVVVAVAAVILALIERRERFRRFSLSYEIEADRLIGVLDMYLLITCRSHEADEDMIERQRLGRPISEYHRYLWSMAEKYLLASDRPWLPVGSDPPPPPKPSREYLEMILNRYNRIPGDPVRPLPPPKSASEYMNDVYERSYQIESVPTQAL
jgi:hypothetical protein